ncbi:hypothetical protein BKA64DRAFT_635008 [Cadophora sp. MPI-SDFR-AT-0126]|nr:hypothetical protein BKA64DRAFT_635008 [Leotiomycetes sp. MPI-SDFR-AT-0126]
MYSLVNRRLISSSYEFLALQSALRINISSTFLNGCRRTKAIPFYKRAEDAEAIPFYKKRAEDAEAIPFYKKRAEDAEAIPFYKKRAEDAEAIPFYKRSEDAEAIPFYKRSEDAEAIPFYKRSEIIEPIPVVKRSEAVPFYEEDELEIEEVMAYYCWVSQLANPQLKSHFGQPRKAHFNVQNSLLCPGK